MVELVFGKYSAGDRFRRELSERGMVFTDFEKNKMTYDFQL
jgi:hypothetical protein